MKLRLDTATNIRKSLNYCANKVLSGELEVKKANCIAYLCNGALASLRVGQDEVTAENMKKIEEWIKEVPSVID